MKPVTKIIKDFLKKGWQNEDFGVGSRSMPILEELHTQLPDLEIMVIEFWSGVRATHRAKKLGTRRIGMLEYGLWPGFIAMTKRRGSKLYSAPPGTPQMERLFGWLGMTGTTNDPVRARRWARAGLAGIITDYPDRFEDFKR